MIHCSFIRVILNNSILQNQKSCSDQKIVENSLHSNRRDHNSEPIHQSSMLRVTIDAIGQCEVRIP